jgi:hypothetical protein
VGSVAELVVVAGAEADERRLADILELVVGRTAADLHVYVWS